MNAIANAAPRATIEDWSRFMRPIALSVRNIPTDDDFRSRVAAIAHAVHVPADWLRQSWRQAEAMRRFQFWPAVFDLAEMFDADLKAARESADRSNRLALPAPEPERGPRNAAEILAVKQAAAAVMAAACIPMGQAHAPAPKPAPVSEGAMLAHYERAAAAGNRAAAFRAETIRKRMIQEISP